LTLHESLIDKAAQALYYESDDVMWRVYRAPWDRLSPERHRTYRRMARAAWETYDDAD
jgi:hypothetical protein